MTRVIDFTIPGRIAAWARTTPLLTRMGKVVPITTKQTRVNEALVRSYAQAAMGSARPFEGPVLLQVWMVRIPPVSWAKKKQASVYWVTGKPDCDNYLKLIGDSLNSIVYRDDSQIARVEMQRYYARDTPECVRVRVETLEDKDALGNPRLAA